MVVNVFEGFKLIPCYNISLEDSNKNYSVRIYEATECGRAINENPTWLSVTPSQIFLINFKDNEIYRGNNSNIRVDDDRGLLLARQLSYDPKQGKTLEIETVEGLRKIVMPRGGLIGRFLPNSNIKSYDVKFRGTGKNLQFHGGIRTIR